MPNQPPTKADYLHDINSPMQSAMSAAGIDDAYLTRKLKQELEAKKPTRLKVKGALSQDKVGQCAKIIGTTGVVYYGEEGLAYGDGETVIQFNDADMTIRQKARMDAHKLRNDYPAKEVNHTLNGISGIVSEVLDEIDGANRGKLPSEEEEGG